MQLVRRDGSPHVVASPRLGRGSDSSMATASWSGTSTCTSMSGIESHAALCLATPYHDACYRSVNGGDHPGEAFQSGSVDHSSNVQRDRRSRWHRVRRGGVPCLSSGGRACRTSGGQRRSAGVARAGGAHGDAAVGRLHTRHVPAGERDAGGGTHGVVGASADGRGSGGARGAGRSPTPGA